MDPDKPGEGAVTPSSASGGVNAEQLKQEIQKVVMGIFKDAVPRMVKQAITESVPSMLDQIAEQAIKETPTDPSAGNPAAGQDKLTLKALQEQIAKLNQGIQERDRKVQEAEQRAREVRLRSEVQSQFAKHLGADSPHLTPYVNHYMSQFADQDGQVMRRIKNEYGEEVFAPAAQAVEELFKSELKHLVQQSKVQNLPGVRQQQNGYPVPQQQPQRQQGLNVMQQEHYEHMVRSGQIDQAQSYAQAILGSQQNGTAQK